MIRAVPKTDNYKLACRRCGGWGRVWIGKERALCDLCVGSGADPARMRFAYADPPYLGCGKLYPEHPNARDWDDPATHYRLIDRLFDEYPDGWVLSCHEPSLHLLRAYAGRDCRTGIWVKPFAVFKPNVNPAYAWEPVVFRGGRKFERYDDKVRDWVAANIRMQTGTCGSKPRNFCRWVFSLLNARQGDTLDDLFPGSVAVSAAWAEWVGEQSPLPMLPLELKTAQ